MKRNLWVIAVIALVTTQNLSGCSKKQGEQKAAQGNSQTTPGGVAQTTGTTPVGAGTQSEQKSGALSNAQLAAQNAAGTAPAANTPAQQAQKADTPKQKQCFTAQFTAKNKINGEMSSAVLSMKELDFNAKTFCVRVNGNPVKYQVINKKGTKKIEALRITDIHVATAKITVNYCLGKETCNEDCKIPKDEFMDALGAGDDSANKGWGDAADAEMVGKVSAEIQKELADDSQDIAELIQSTETPACANALAAR